MIQPLAMPIGPLLAAAQEMLNCFTMADVEAFDAPLTYVNPAFCALTGYAFHECVGRNLRFLRGPLTSPQSAKRIAASINHRDAIYQDIVNYKKDGTPFWNRMLLFPVTVMGKGLHYIGLQNDVTELKKRVGFSFTTASVSSVSSLELQDKIVNPLTALLLNRSLLQGELDQTRANALQARIAASLERLLASILRL